MADPVVFGIDPGARHTGTVVRLGDRLYGHEVIEGDPTTDLPAIIGRLRYLMDLIPGGVDLIAAEDVTAPVGFKGGKRDPINPKGLIGTAMVLGGVIATWPFTIVVPPGGHGSAFIRSYPKDLIGPREGPAGTGKLRHCRSAWDIAGAGARLASINRRLRAHA